VELERVTDNCSGCHGHLARAGTGAGASGTFKEPPHLSPTRSRLYRKTGVTGRVPGSGRSEGPAFQALGHRCAMAQPPTALVFRQSLNKSTQKGKRVPCPRLSWACGTHRRIRHGHASVAMAPHFHHFRYYVDLFRAYPKTCLGWLGHSAAMPQMAENWGFASLQPQPPTEVGRFWDKLLVLKCPLVRCHALVCGPLSFSRRQPVNTLP
jgi:hypothetical protein